MTTEAPVVADPAVEAAAEQAAAETAFSTTLGVEPVVVEAPVKTDAEIAADIEAEAAEQARAAEEAWLQGVPAGLRESIVGLPGRLRNLDGHIGGLTSQAKELRATIAAAQAAAKAVGDSPTDSQMAAATQSSEKWDQIKEDFPDWAEAMEERLSKVRGGSSAAPVDVAALKAELRQEIALDSVEEAHAGWNATVATPEFSTWFNSQPDDIKALANSDRARDAIKMLDAFALASKPNNAPADPPVRQDPKARLEAAIGPKTAPTVLRRVPESEEDAAAAAFRRIRGG